VSARVQYGGEQKTWQSQLPIDYLDASLTINTWETVDADLSEGDPARLVYVIVEQTNNGAAVEDIELEITINGTAYTWTLSGIASGALIYCGISANLATGDFETVSQATNPRMVQALDDDHSHPFVAESIGLIRTQQTSAVDGVSAQIEVNIVWDKLVVP